jgi:lipoate-protein ligase A
VVLTGRSWRILQTPPLTGAENMALDEALMSRARRTGECVFRTYAWRRPTLSLGRHQLVRDRIDVARARSRGVDVVRRPTGGRALLHHREVTYSVTAPLPAGESARRWYDALNDVLLAALQSLGVSAVPATVVGRTPAPGSASCFLRPDAGEISVAGRKLVGSAVLREQAALLQHGSILLEDDQGMLADFLPEGRHGGPAPASLREALGTVPDAALVVRALHEALRAVVSEAPLLAIDEVTEHDARLAAERYASETWTFLR